MSSKPVYHNYFPLVFTLGYVAFGFVLSVFGPVVYLDYNYGPVAWYLLAFGVLFSVGYFLGLQTPVRQVRMRPEDMSGPDWRFNALLFSIAMIYLAMLLYSMATGGIVYSFSAAGENYSDIYQDYERNSGNYSLSFLLSQFLYFPTVATITLGSYYFPKASKKIKILFILFIVSYVSYFVFGLGKQKQLGDLFVFMAVAAMIRIGQSGRRIKTRTKFFLLVGICIVVLVFSAVLQGRYAAIGIDAYNINEKQVATQQLNLDHWLMKLLGPGLGFPVALFTSYLSNGYYGLSLAMQLDFVWTGFIGNSYSLMVIYNKFLGGDFFLHDTYAFRAGETFDWGLSKWHTGFTWLAGDFTFYGALLVYAAVAFLLARVWLEAVRLGRVSSILMFGLIFLGIVFLPANNQLVIGPGSLVSFYGLLFYILLVRRPSLPRRRSGPSQPAEASPQSRV